jgi:hypothetical protein
MSVKDGGAAFPLAVSIEDEAQEGMSLRDYFAAAALQGLVASDVYRLERGLEGKIKVGEIAYVIADAMLEARKQ